MRITTPAIGSQREIDHYWGKLSADPKAEQCGWLKDKFGLSWQVVPTAMHGSMVEGEVVLLAAAFLAHRGYFSLPLVILAATAGNTIADQIYYQVARARGRAAFERKAAEDARYARMRDWVGRRGAVLLFVSRFLYGLRIAIPGRRSV